MPKIKILRVRLLKLLNTLNLSNQIQYLYLNRLREKVKSLYEKFAIRCEKVIIFFENGDILIGF